LVLGPFFLSSPLSFFSFVPTQARVDTSALCCHEIEFNLSSIADLTWGQCQRCYKGDAIACCAILCSGILCCDAQHRVVVRAVPHHTYSSLDTLYRPISSNVMCTVVRYSTMHICANRWTGMLLLCELHRAHCNVCNRTTVCISHHIISQQITA
jgi:hypothetical protein